MISLTMIKRPPTKSNETFAGTSRKTTKIRSLQIYPEISENQINIKKNMTCINTLQES